MSGMEHLGPHRRFRGSNDLSGIPQVKRRRAIPLRETPLDGTRQLLSPKSGDLRHLVAGRQFTDMKIGMDARVCGWIALGLAASLFPGFLIAVGLGRLESAAWQSVAGGLELALIVAFFLAHLCAGLSQLFSNWQERNGVRGLMLCWASVVMMVVAEWVIALFVGALA